MQRAGAYKNKTAKLNNQPAVNFNSADGKKRIKQIKSPPMNNDGANAMVEGKTGQPWK